MGQNVPVDPLAAVGHFHHHALTGLIAFQPVVTADMDAGAAI